MRPVFDLDKLSQLFRDFHEITRIRITAFDSEFHELTAYPEALTPFCQVLRATEQGDQACRACDQAACARAADARQVHLYRCHAGLTEAIMPLYVGETLAGYLLFGQVFSYPTQAEGRAQIEGLIRRYPADRAALLRAYEESPLISEAYIHAAAHILHAVASFLILERMAAIKEDKTAQRLDSYIAEHFTEEITAATLCERFRIGKTQLYALSTQLYGCGIAQQVRKLRMALAKRLLTEQPDMTVAEIAFACGYSDYNYFISVFSKSEGMSPNKYRRTQIQDILQNMLNLRNDK